MRLAFGSLQGLTILMVDSNAELLESTASYLSREGATVFTAVNTNAVLRICKQEQHKIDIVCSEVDVEHLNGIDMCSQIQRMHPRVKIIFTAHPETRALVAARFHAIPFVEKPYSLSVLKHVFCLVMKNEFETLLKDEMPQSKFGFLRPPSSRILPAVKRG